MSSIERTKAVVNALLNRTVPNAKVVKIVDGILYNSGAEIEGMENEDKATLFLSIVKDNLKARYQSAAIAKTQVANEQAEKTAEKDAEADFE